MENRKIEKDLIEEVKEFWDKRPCNIRHTNKHIGTKEYFDEVEEKKYFVEPHIIKFAEFDRWNNKKVLEIGCGIGTDTINFARKGARITAVELSEKSLELARHRAKIYGLEDKIRFYLGNAEELSNFVPLEKYDLIYSFGVVYHTQNPENIFKEIKKYCNNNTLIKIMVYHKYSWKVLWILLKFGKLKFWDIKNLVKKYSEAQEGCPVTYIFSKKEIKRILERNGFKLISIKVDHISPYKISDYIQRKYNKVWYFKILPESIFRFLEKKFGWHLLVESKLA